MQKILEEMLQAILDRMKAGNSNISEQQALNLIEVIKPYTLYDPYITASKAHIYLGISMKTFRNLVKDGKIPKGIKKAGDSSLKWLKTDILKYSQETGKVNKFGITLD